MNFEDLFRDYWWLLFPLFGMFMGLVGMFQMEQRSAKAMDLIKAYIDQGKEPPPELLKLAAVGENVSSRTPRESRAWSFITFAAISVGLGLGYYFVQGHPLAFVFLIGAVVMGIMALGSLILLITSKKS